MKKSFVLLAVFLGTAGAWAAETPHYDLEMSSQEYRKILPALQAQDLKLKPDPVDSSLRAGVKLFDWIDLINSKRPEDQKIRLTSKSTRKGIPITAPNRYGPVRISNTLKELKKDFPKAMADIVFGNQKATSDALMDDKSFIQYGRRMDRLYQTASRWKLLEPYKGFYSSRRIQDVRGYYFLTENGWDAERLGQEWTQLKGQVRREVITGLVGICVNSGLSSAGCRADIEDTTTSTEAVRFYNRHITRAQQIWNRFFDIRGKRRDIEWKGLDSTVAKIPFFDPKDDAVRAYVKDNIEDEFRWENWGLKLNFVKRKPAPYIVFVPGATPNVNGLGGNKITMDGNKPLGEYEVQWIIRHEFGHVLGIPDCYHEFYDTDKNEFVNYQLDTTDLMCSRAGNMNERLYLQLRDTYAKY